MGNHLRKEYDDMKEAYNIVQSNYQHLSAEHKALKEGMERRMEQQSALHQRICDLEGLIQDLKQEYAQLHYKSKRDSEIHDKAALALREQAALSREQCAVLHSQLDALQAKHDAYIKKQEKYVHVKKNWCCLGK